MHQRRWFVVMPSTTSRCRLPRTAGNRHGRSPSRRRLPLSKPLMPLKPFQPSEPHVLLARSRGFSRIDASRRCRRASRRSDAPAWEAASRRAFSLRTTVRRAGLQLGPGGLGNHGGGRDTPGLRSPRPWSPPTSGWPCPRPAQAPRSPDPVKPGSVKPGSVKPSTR